MADNDADSFAAFMATVDGEIPQPKETNLNNEYKNEDQQEKEAMMKNYHHPMKQWFRQRPQLKEMYGPFPLFWQELKMWEPYRKVLKAYIKFTEHGDDEERDEKSPATQNLIEKASENVSNAGEPIKKRRRSRWGDPVESAADGSEERKRKKSRWAPASSSSTAGGLLDQKQQQILVLRAQLEDINQKLRTVAIDAAVIEKDPNRSPSPPPQYDSNGKRTNTREVRMKAALETRRRETIDQLIKINPLFRPPADYTRQKLNRKIYIPIRDFPSYNFIGLIIGPRGNTQKRMERDTNCKIAIRGKGSVKEGSKGKKQANADENDELHVLITGDREEDLDKAAKEVQSLLVPVDDTKNSHKQKQLRELALINGTLRDDDYCHICGEKGHRQWECPNRDAHRTFKAANIKCAICGDLSHPTRDCTQKKSVEENAAIDKEYQQFMQQLGETNIISTATNSNVSEAPVTSAPWLQPAKTTSSATMQPWMIKQSVGAPGTASAAGLQAPATVALGSTPATAFPPPVAPTGAYDFQAQGQNWGLHGWNGGYNSYRPWGQGADYQVYGHYVPPASCVDANAQAPGVSEADQYQYPPYGNPPQ
ncbi:hypothetical protein PsorP6_002458 [Peronosclerospora sorghi]|uniref:Uncharacterized protein n=1 Tax=Peronosclerospora sorghi TaxID=230839 RepID=A0ACC0WUE1_9STRA|nr:hypothetical protein PsorP6_002458 [Peronosclerospora sorghi]